MALSTNIRQTMMKKITKIATPVISTVRGYLESWGLLVCCLVLDCGPGMVLASTEMELERLAYCSSIGILSIVNLK